MSIVNSPTRTAALLSGAFTFMFGLWLILPHDALAGRPTFVIMAEMLPEFAWAMIFMIAGFLKLWGAVNNKYRSAKTGSWILTVTWVVVALSFWFSDWTSPIVWFGTYLAIQAGHHHAMTSRDDYAT